MVEKEHKIFIKAKHLNHIYMLIFLELVVISMSISFETSSLFVVLFRFIYVFDSNLTG